MKSSRALRQFLRGEFRAEAESGFARLRRVPDTRVRLFLDYYAALDASQQAALGDAAALSGTLWLVKGSAPSGWRQELQGHPGREEWLAYSQSIIASPFRPEFLPYYSVPILRAAVQTAGMDRHRGRSTKIPDWLVKYAESLRAVQALELRKQVRVALKSLLGAKPVNLGGGDWEYPGSLDGSPVTVGIDYGSKFAQLHYGVSVEGLSVPVPLLGTTFEGILGISSGKWNVIVEDNVADSMTVLAEFVKYVQELPGRLPAWR